MPSNGTVETNAEESLFLPASRVKALTRALVWFVPTALLGGSTLLIYRSLHFTPTGVSNRITEYLVAIATLPVAVGSLICVFRGLQWLLLAVWPGRVGLIGEADALVLQLGPFGRRRYPAVELDIRYPYELDDDADEDGGYEAYLPEEEQKAKLLPRIMHRRAPAPINETILRFLAGMQDEIVTALRPAIERWRGDGAGTADETHAR